jgi:hypothetical protein
MHTMPAKYVRISFYLFERILLASRLIIVVKFRLLPKLSNEIIELLTGCLIKEECRQPEIKTEECERLLARREECV